MGVIKPQLTRFRKQTATGSASASASASAAGAATRPSPSAVSPAVKKLMEQVESDEVVGLGGLVSPGGARDDGGEMADAKDQDQDQTDDGLGMIDPDLEPEGEGETMMS